MLTEKNLRWVFKARWVLMAPPVLFMLFATFWEVENDLVVFPVGGLILLAGFLIRVWAQIHLHYRLRIHKVLTTTGPYGYVRNPIYIANSLILLGMCVMSKLIWFTPLLALWCAAVYSLVVRYEELHLTAKYGEPYREFLGRVPRWLPRRGVPQASNIGLTREFLAPSILAELHCFLWILPVLIKELLGEH